MLIKCLDLLAPSVQTLSTESYEVIVTDDSKENLARELIERKYRWVKWIAGPKRGPAANRNHGAKVAISEWLVFIDDDCLPNLDLLEVYYLAVKYHPESFAFEGAILPDNWNGLKKDLSECPINVNGGCFWSANICVKTSLFKEVRGFDEDFLMAAQEDQHLYFKIKKVSPTVFLPKAFVIHPVRIISLKRKIVNNQRSVENWFLFTRKTGMSFSRAIKSGLLFNLKDLKRNLLIFKIKSSIVNFQTILICLPILMLKYAFRKKC